MIIKQLSSATVAVILGLATQAGLAKDYCWTVEDDNDQGSGRLYLAGMDFGEKNLFVAGRLTVTLQAIPDVRPMVVAEQYLTGAAEVVPGGIEVTLSGSDIQRTNTNPNEKVWNVAYHVMLNNALNGVLTGTMMHDDGTDLIEEYREAQMQSVALSECPIP